MTPVDTTEIPADEVAPADEPAEDRVISAAKTFASRADWLAQAGKLQTEEKHVEGLGWLLLSEVSADVRADIMTDQSAVLLAEGPNKKLDRKAYERKLLLAGVVDPLSPADARQPLFQRGDLDQVMKVGGAKIGEVIDAIEKLSLLGRYAASAEGNSSATPNGDGTSA